MQIDVSGTPYLLGDQEGEAAVFGVMRDLAERMELLRRQGKLTEDTLRDYYGQTRFAQIAESNALEGSTLSVGETELAVLKGITVTGHDPAYSRDARALATALDALTSLAREQAPTTITQLLKLHELILADRQGAGSFRSIEVRIRGSAHVPPRTWREVMDAMEQWERWSVSNASAPPLLRAAVLHAWLEHIHPFVDGNGRVGRAITNLELVRAGYPPIIIRRKDRDQYLDALARADEADLGPFIDIIATRTDHALREMERAATRRQGYDVLRERIRKANESRLAVWNAGVDLLLANISSCIAEIAGDSAEVFTRRYDQLSVDDFIDLCEGRPVSASWAFSIRCRIAGGAFVEFLAWTGYPGERLKQRLAQDGGRPALMWSIPNPKRYPPWIRADERSPGGEQLTIVRDRWLIVRAGNVSELAPSELGEVVARDIVAQALPSTDL
jgi:Fic family protein